MSEFNGMSIQERIRAMNRTIDKIGALSNTPEITSRPGGTSYEDSKKKVDIETKHVTKEDTFNSNSSSHNGYNSKLIPTSNANKSQDTQINKVNLNYSKHTSSAISSEKADDEDSEEYNKPQQRTSVVDMWRKREAAAAAVGSSSSTPKAPSRPKVVLNKWNPSPESTTTSNQIEDTVSKPTINNQLMTAVTTTSAPVIRRTPPPPSEPPRVVTHTINSSSIQAVKTSNSPKVVVNSSMVSDQRNSTPKGNTPTWATKSPMSITATPKSESPSYNYNISKKTSTEQSSPSWIHKSESNQSDVGIAVASKFTTSHTGSKVSDDGKSPSHRPTLRAFPRTSTPSTPTMTTRTTTMNLSSPSMISKSPIQVTPQSNHDMTPTSASKPSWAKRSIFKSNSPSSMTSPSDSKTPQNLELSKSPGVTPSWGAHSLRPTKLRLSSENDADAASAPLVLQKTPQEKQASPTVAQVNITSTEKENTHDSNLPVTSLDTKLSIKDDAEAQDLSNVLQLDTHIAVAKIDDDNDDIEWSKTSKSSILDFKSAVDQDPGNIFQFDTPMHDDRMKGDVLGLEWPTSSDADPDDPIGSQHIHEREVKDTAASKEVFEQDSLDHGTKKSMVIKTKSSSLARSGGSLASAVSTEMSHQAQTTPPLIQLALQYKSSQSKLTPKISDRFRSPGAKPTFLRIEKTPNLKNGGVSQVTAGESLLSTSSHSIGQTDQKDAKLASKGRSLSAPRSVIQHTGSKYLKSHLRMNSPRDQAEESGQQEIRLAAQGKYNGSPQLRSAGSQSPKTILSESKNTLNNEGTSIPRSAETPPTLAKFDERQSQGQHYQTSNGPAVLSLTAVNSSSVNAVRNAKLESPSKSMPQVALQDSVSISKAETKQRFEKENIDVIHEKDAINEMDENDDIHSLGDYSRKSVESQRSNQTFSTNIVISPKSCSLSVPEKKRELQKRRNRLKGKDDDRSVTSADAQSTYSQDSPSISAPMLLQSLLQNHIKSRESVNSQNIYHSSDSQQENANRSSKPDPPIRHIGQRPYLEPHGFTASSFHQSDTEVKTVDSSRDILRLSKTSVVESSSRNISSSILMTNKGDLNDDDIHESKNHGSSQRSNTYIPDFLSSQKTDIEAPKEMEKNTSGRKGSKSDIGLSDVWNFLTGDLGESNETRSVISSTSGASALASRASKILQRRRNGRASTTSPKEMVESQSDKPSFPFPASNDLVVRETNETTTVSKNLKASKSEVATLTSTRNTLQTKSTKKSKRDAIDRSGFVNRYKSSDRFIDTPSHDLLKGLTPKVEDHPLHSFSYGSEVSATSSQIGASSEAESFLHSRPNSTRSDNTMGGINRNFRLESSSNMMAMRSAYKNISTNELINDFKEEVSETFKGSLGVIKNLATGLGKLTDASRSGCDMYGGTECETFPSKSIAPRKNPSRPKISDEEEVAIEVEYIGDEEGELAANEEFPLDEKLPTEKRLSSNIPGIPVPAGQSSSEFYV